MAQLTLDQLAGWINALLWPFLRIGALMMAMPVIGAASVPVRIRVLLAAAIAWLLLPVLPPMPAYDFLSSQGLLVSIFQVGIGLAMGFILQLVFGLFVVAGQSIAMAMGLGFASAVDPQNGIQVPVVSQGLLLLVTLVFLAMNGHLLLFQLLADSFRLLPVGVIAPDPEALWRIALWGSHLFAGGLLVALPAVTGLLLVNIAFGVAARAAPQLNIFAVGFPVMLLAGFVLMVVLLPGLGDHLGRALGEAYALMRNLMEP